MLTLTLERYIESERQEQPMLTATVVLHALLLLRGTPQPVDNNRIEIETPKPVEPRYSLPIDRSAHFKYLERA